jgi:hypothetical protein
MMVENTVNLIKDVETATDLKNFPTKTSILCNWCEYKAQCPEYSHQYASKTEVPKLDTTTMTAAQAAETVDKLVELREKKKILSEDMDAMVATLESKLMTYSKESGHNSVFGKDYKASFNSYESFRMPDKKDLRRYELESTLKDMNLWDNLQEMSPYKLKSMLKSDKITPEQKKQLSEYMDNDNNTRLSLKKL